MALPEQEAARPKALPRSPKGMEKKMTSTMTATAVHVASQATTWPDAFIGVVLIVCGMFTFMFLVKSI